MDDSRVKAVDELLEQWSAEREAPESQTELSRTITALRVEFRVARALAKCADDLGQMKVRSHWKTKARRLDAEITRLEETQSRLYGPYVTGARQAIVQQQETINRQRAWAHQFMAEAWPINGVATRKVSEQKPRCEYTTKQKIAEEIGFVNLKMIYAETGGQGTQQKHEAEIAAEARLRASVARTQKWPHCPHCNCNANLVFEHVWATTGESLHQAFFVCEECSNEG